MDNVTESQNTDNQDTEKSRGLFIVLENIFPELTVDEMKDIELQLKMKTGNQLIKVMKIPNPPTPLQTKVSDIKQKSSKMGNRANHMINAMERWKMREELLSTLESGFTVILLNFGFKEIVDTLDEFTSLQWAKTQYVGFLRPDLVLYNDDDAHLLSKSFDYLKYFQNINERPKEENIVKRIFSGKNVTSVNNEKNDIKNIVTFINRIKMKYSLCNKGEFEFNFYPFSIGEDLFMHKEY